MEMQSALHKLVDRRDLTEDEMAAVMDDIMEGRETLASIAAFLTALRMKGESVDEITGAAKVMRRKAGKLRTATGPLVDTCGTGGDGASTFNISTAAAFVAAGAGVAVAKHGNRAVSGKSGSADVLKCLGVNIEADAPAVERCLKETGIGFLFAPAFHRAMKHAAEARRLLGFRTIFNLLGPLTNPAGAHAQVVGVYEDRWLAPLARVLKALGCRHALVVHGADGLDEITLTGGTKVCELRDGELKEYGVSPEEFGLRPCAPAELKGGGPETNAEIIRRILSGEGGAPRDIVLLNAAAAILVGGKAESLAAGLQLAKASIDSGAAAGKLRDLCRVSNQK